MTSEEFKQDIIKMGEQFQKIKKAMKKFGFEIVHESQILSSILEKIPKYKLGMSDGGCMGTKETPTLHSDPEGYLVEVRDIKRAIRAEIKKEGKITD